MSNKNNDKITKILHQLWLKRLLVHERINFTVSKTTFKGLLNEEYHQTSKSASKKTKNKNQTKKKEAKTKKPENLDNQQKSSN